MKYLRIVVLFVITPLIAGRAFSQRSAVEDGRAFHRASIEAYEAGDFAGFLDLTGKALALRPGHPSLIYNFAAAFALNGREEDALVWLRRYAEMGLGGDIDEDQDFEALFDWPVFREIAGDLRENEEPLVRSDRAFVMDQPDFFPEGIAFDERTGRFFLSSVYRRQIVQWRDGKASAVAVFDDGRSPLALAVDSERRRLWVAASVVPEIDSTATRSALVAFDLETFERHAVLEEDAFLGDLGIDTEGRVYVSSPTEGLIYALSDGSEIIPLVRAGTLASPQGIVIPPSGGVLFVADYAQGLFRIDLSTSDVSQLPGPEDAMLLGIDGLAWYEGRLLAIQNGSRPQRLLQLTLNASMTAIDRVEVLESSHPDFDEPTTGVVIGDWFFYIANGQWGHLKDQASARPPVVLKLNLP